MFAVNISLIKAMVFLLALILVNIILGICVALKEERFALRELPRFLRTEILPYYISLMALTALAMLEDVQGYGVEPLTWAAIAAYGTKTVFVEIRGKVQSLLGI